MATKIRAVHGDITKMYVDAIVNAANHDLLGGDGVDGAIHAAAGPELLEECTTLGGCATGEAKATKGYGLPVKYVIHTVGPRYGGEDGDEDVLLANCYLNSLKLGKELKVRSLAFPNISTGVFRYPKEEAAEIAIKTAQKFIKENPRTFDKLIFVSYTEKDFNIFKREFDNLVK